MAALLFACACALTAARSCPAAPPDPAQLNPNPVTIGVVLPLTGGYAEWAERIRQGLEIGAEDAAHDFLFQYHDEGPCDNAARSLSAGQKLLADGVKVIISGCLSGTKVLGPLAKRRRALLLSPGLLDLDVLGHQYPLINLATEIPREAEYLARVIVSANVKRLASLRAPDAFGEEFATRLSGHVTAAGVAVAHNELVNEQYHDFRSLLLRLKQSGVDGIFVNSLGREQLQTVMRQRSELKLDLPVFANYVVESNAPDAGQTAMLEGIRYTYPVNSAEGTAAKSAFDRRFRGKFGGAAPVATSYFAYDGLLLLDAALAHCRASDTGCIRARIANSEKRSGISGEMTINTDGSNARPYGLKQVIKGRFEWLEKNLALR